MGEARDLDSQRPNAAKFFLDQRFYVIPYVSLRIQGVVHNEILLVSVKII
jgi:hypothetical protein